MLKGMRRSIQGVNAYQAGRSLSDVMREYGLEHVVKLGSNENSYGPFPMALQAMAGEIDRVNIYPEENFRRLRILLGQRFGLGQENIGIGHGAGGVLDALSRTFIEEGDEVIVPKQTYGLYREISRLMGAALVEVPLRSYRIDLRDIRDAVTERTKLIWLCNPNNPTGTLFDRELLEPLSDMLPDSAWIIADEAYSEFADPSLLPDTVGMIKQGRNIASVRTFSKYYGLAGARIGYVIGSAELIRVYDTVSEPFNANRTGLAGAVATLRHDREAAEDAANSIRRDREELAGRLRELGCGVVPSEANFLFFSAGHDAAVLSERLVRKGVIVRPCTGWGYPEHIRVTIGTGPENGTFLKALGETLPEQAGES